MAKVLGINDIDVKKIQFSDFIKGNYSDRRTFISYNGSSFNVELPPLKQSKYGPPNEKFDTEAKHDLRIPLDKTSDNSKKVDELEKMLQNLDDFFGSEEIKKKFFEPKLYKKAKYLPIIKKSNDDDEDDDNEKKLNIPSFKGKFKIRTKESKLNEELLKKKVARDEYYLEEDICRIQRNGECISNDMKIKDIKQILSKELYQSTVSLLVEINNVWIGNIQGVPSYKVNIFFLIVNYKPSLLSAKNINIAEFKFKLDNKIDNSEDEDEDKIDTKELEKSNTIDTEDTDELNEKVEELDIDSDEEEIEEKKVEKKSKKGKKKKEVVNTN